MSVCHREKKNNCVIITANGNSGGGGGAGKDGKNVGFSLEDGKPGKSGHSGFDGDPGVNGGKIVCNLSRKDRNTVIVSGDCFGFDYHYELTTYLDPPCAVRLEAIGGAGGPGGTGGKGGKGGEGSRGENATKQRRGGDGGRGGPGGPGGPGGDGGHGGHGGTIEVICAEEDMDLISLLRGKTGNVSGGPGGKGGNPGEGGKGGKGGRGGHGFHWTEVSNTYNNYGQATTRTSRTHQMPGGSNGAEGPRGNRGTMGSRGPNGNAGKFLITVKSEDGKTASYRTPYNVGISKSTFKEIEVSPYGMYEPGMIFEMKNVYRNIGGMPFPTKQDINMTLHCSKRVECGYLLSMPHDLKPQQEVEKTLPFSLKDLEEPIIGEPLNENVAFAQSVYLNDCYQVFKECSKADHQINIRYPVILSPMKGVCSVLMGEEAPMVFRVENVSPQALGTHATPARVCFTEVNIDFEGVKGLLSHKDCVIRDAHGFEFHTTKNGFFNPLPNFIEREKGYVGLTYAFTNPETKPYTRVKIKASLFLGYIRDLKRPVEIQIRPFYVQLAEKYVPNEEARVLLVTNNHTTAEEIDAWNDFLSKTMGMKSVTWNVNLYNDFCLAQKRNDGKSLLDDFRNGYIIFLSNKYSEDEVDGGRYTHEFIRTQELFLAAKMYKIKILIFGGNQNIVKNMSFPLYDGKILPYKSPDDFVSGKMPIQKSEKEELKEKEKEEKKKTKRKNELEKLREKERIEFEEKEKELEKKKERGPTGDVPCFKCCLLVVNKKIRWTTLHTRGKYKNMFFVYEKGKPRDSYPEVAISMKEATMKCLDGISKFRLQTPNVTVILRNHRKKDKRRVQDFEKKYPLPSVKCQDISPFRIFTHMEEITEGKDPDPDAFSPPPASAGCKRIFYLRVDDEVKLVALHAHLKLMFFYNSCDPQQTTPDTCVSLFGAKLETDGKRPVREFTFTTPEATYMLTNLTKDEQRDYEERFKAHKYGTFRFGYESSKLYDNYWNAYGWEYDFKKAIEDAQKGPPPRLPSSPSSSSPSSSSPSSSPPSSSSPSPSSPLSSPSPVVQEKSDSQELKKPEVLKPKLVEMDSPNIPFFDFEVRHLVGVPKSSEIEKKAEALSQKLSNKYPDQKNIVVYKFNSNQEKRAGAGVYHLGNIKVYQGFDKISPQIMHQNLDDVNVHKPSIVNSNGTYYCFFMLLDFTQKLEVLDNLLLSTPLPSEPKFESLFVKDFEHSPLYGCFFAILSEIFREQFVLQGSKLPDMRSRLPRLDELRDYKFLSFGEEMSSLGRMKSRTGDMLIEIIMHMNIILHEIYPNKKENTLIEIRKQQMKEIFDTQFFLENGIDAKEVKSSLPNVLEQKREEWRKAAFGHNEAWGYYKSKETDPIESDSMTLAEGYLCPPFVPFMNNCFSGDGFSGFMSETDFQKNKQEMRESQVNENQDPKVYTKEERRATIADFQVRLGCPKDLTSTTLCKICPKDEFTE